MEYQLICQGRLLAGAKKKECVGRIQRITKLSEEKVLTTLLNGRPRKMFSSRDKNRVEKFGHAFRNAGLDIIIQNQAIKNFEKSKAGYL
ncbi:Ribosomal protein L7/L12 C-terminal domain-containing protein [Candidatus Electrothrix laxa]